MSTYLNEVNLIGRVGGNVEIYKKDDKMIATFSLATSEVWRDKHTDEKKEKTQWHKIVIYSTKLAEIAQNYISKGTLVFVSGKIAYEKWKEEGSTEKEHYKTSIILDVVNSKLIILEKNSGSNSSSSSEKNEKSSKNENTSSEGEFDIPF